MSSGWADVSAKRYESALVPWNILVQREHTDSAVQEAMLALPYAYSQLAVYGRAAVLYSQALQSYGQELGKLHASIDSIRAGKFLKALVREEIHQDKDWVVRLRSLPESPETYYLMELLASHDFQSALQNYLDLEDLRQRLDTWQRNFAAYEDLIEHRRAYYEPLLPGLDQQFRELDSRRRVRVEQHKILTDRLQNMLVAPRPELLATTNERVLIANLDGIEGRITAADGGPDAKLLMRVGRLRGLVTWDLKTQYHERLTTVLRASAGIAAGGRQAHRTVQRIRSGAAGRDAQLRRLRRPIKRLRTRVDNAIQHAKLLMSRQGNVLEQVAIAELELRSRRLEDYEVRARYAMADSYDRATATQQQAKAE